MRVSNVERPEGIDPENRRTDVVSWDAIFKIIGAVGLLITAAVVVVAMFRAKSEDTWRKTAEQRKADLDDLRTRYTEQKEKLKDAERERDDFTQRYLRAQAKVEWYDARHGPIPPSDIHSSTSRG